MHVFQHETVASAHLGHGTVNVGGDQNAMGVDDLVLVHDADDIPAGHGHALADRRAGGEGPAHAPREARRVHSLRDVHVSALLEDVLEGALDAVEDRAHDAGPELHGEGLLLPQHRVADGEAGGVLVDLDGGRVPLELDDLAHELRVADANELVHRRAGHVVGDDEGAGHLEDEAVVRFLLVLLHGCDFLVIIFER